MKKYKIAALLVIACVFSSLITSIVKAQDKITLSANIAEVKCYKDVVDLTGIKAQLDIEAEEIIIYSSTIVESENNTTIENAVNEEPEVQDLVSNNMVNINDIDNEICEVVIIPSITGTIEIEEIIEY